MKIILYVLSLFLTELSIGQIPLKKILSFSNNSYSFVTDYLIQFGWDYKGTDTTNGFHNTWTLGFNETTNSAIRWIRCYFKKYPKLDKDSIYKIEYINISKEEFEQIYKDLPLLGFIKTRTMDFQGALDIVFEKRVLKGEEIPFFMGELVSFVKPDEISKRTYYQFSILYFD
jgi:hypothetical protein